MSKSCSVPVFHAVAVNIREGGGGRRAVRVRHAPGDESTAETQQDATNVVLVDRLHVIDVV